MDAQGGGGWGEVMDSLQDTHCRKKCADERSNLDSG